MQRHRQSCEFPRPICTLSVFFLPLFIPKIWKQPLRAQAAWKHRFGPGNPYYTSLNVRAPLSCPRFVLRFQLWRKWQDVSWKANTTSDMQALPAPHPEGWDSESQRRKREKISLQRRWRRTEVLKKCSCKSMRCQLSTTRPLTHIKAVTNASTRKACSERIDSLVLIETPLSISPSHCYSHRLHIVGL